MNTNDGRGVSGVRVGHFFLSYRLPRQRKARPYGRAIILHSIAPIGNESKSSKRYRHTFHSQLPGQT
jgi:hypothetical protein